MPVNELQAHEFIGVQISDINKLYPISVQIHAHTALGRIALPGRQSRAAIGGEHLEATIGGGDATLEIESSMGSVVVTA